MCPCYCSGIICTCYSSMNLAHSEAHLHPSGAWLPFTHRICPHLEKDSLLISLQHQVQMFGQLSCSISNDHLDLTVLAEKKAARASSLERLSFLGRKCLFTFSPCSEHRVLSLRAQPQSSEGCPQAGIQRLGGEGPELGLLGQGQLYVPRGCGFAQWSSEMDTVVPTLMKQPSSPGRHQQV